MLTISTHARDSAARANPFGPLLRAVAVAPVLEFLGVRVRCLVSAEDTDGAWSLLEYTAPAHFAGPPAHYHGRTTELFYVLDGALTLEHDAASEVLLPGGVAVVPPCAVHRFGNPAPRPCRFLIQLSPSGMEGYFGELARLVRGVPGEPLPEPHALDTLARRFDTFSPPVF